MDKRFWMVIGVICTVFVGFLVFKGGSNTTTNSSAPPTNHVRGQSAKNVTFVEYGDYQCSACATFAPTVKAVTEKYQDRVIFQFRNYPLTQIHQNALASARAAEAAGLQGKFWEMHDMLYENQETWSSSDSALSIFTSYASSLGLNLTQFKTDYASSKVNDSINADKAAFLKLNLPEATPTFILDGKKISPEVSVDSFSKFIDAELAKK